MIFHVHGAKHDARCHSDRDRTGEREGDLRLRPHQGQRVLAAALVDGGVEDVDHRAGDREGQRDSEHHLHRGVRQYKGVSEHNVDVGFGFGLRPRPRSRRAAP
eukprot:6195251-Prymnesium_polylepis.2